MAGWIDKLTNAARGLKRPSFLKGRNGALIVGGAAIVLLGAWAMFGRGEDEAPYRTAQVDRGAITRVVSATGTLQPLVSVNVGSTVSGLALSVEADFNSTVRAGQVLARLEPDTFQQRVDQASASLRQAQADYGVADADYQRYAMLEQRGFASPQLMLQKRVARENAGAAVAQARAALATAQTDLDRSVIRSPITGVVVDRQINPGQSVAASFQAPTLFVIAQDLSRLQANITVDEADIGEVREGLTVRFTVDAFPDQEFEGRVAQVRQQGVNTNNVVSYTVVVEADNPGRRLLPGMTANAEIIIQETQNVARLPNAALRFRPTDPDLAARGQAMAAGGGVVIADARASSPGAGQGQGGQRGGRALAQLTEDLQLTSAQQQAARQAIQTAMDSAPRPGEGASQAERRAFQRRMREAALAALEPSFSPQQRQLLAQMRAAPVAGAPREVRRQAVAWVLRDGKPIPVSIEVGAADESHTHLLGGLQEGDQVIIGGGPPAPASQREGAPMGGGGPRIRGA